MLNKEELKLKTIIYIIKKVKVKVVKGLIINLLIITNT
jgi:hypothetical protein